MNRAKVAPCFNIGVWRHEVDDRRRWEIFLRTKKLRLRTLPVTPWLSMWGNP